MPLRLRCGVAAAELDVANMLPVRVGIEEDIENAGGSFVLPNLGWAVTAYKARSAKASGNGNAGQTQELLRIVVDLRCREHRSSRLVGGGVCCF